MTKFQRDTKIVDVFASPIALYYFDESEDIKKTTLDIIKKYTKSFNIQNNNLHHYGNEVNESVLDEKKFTKFKEWILQCSENFIKEILGYKLHDTIMITDSWINVCDKDGWQAPHYHTNSYISGTYYVNYKEEHSPLLFNNKDYYYSSQPSIQLETIKSTAYNSNRVIKPIEGNLILWQSHLTHGYESNQLDGRITISFNMMPTFVNSGKYGYKIVK